MIEKTYIFILCGFLGYFSSYRKRSDVWMYFVKISKFVSKCKVCGRDYRTLGGITNLKKHLATQHLIDLIHH